MGYPSPEGFIAFDYRTDVSLVLNKALNGEEAVNFEFPLLTKDDRRLDIRLNSTTRRGQHRPSRVDHSATARDRGSFAAH